MHVEAGSLKRRGAVQPELARDEADLHVQRAQRLGQRQAAQQMAQPDPGRGVDAKGYSHKRAGVRLSAP
jgi:hypothetical protein